MVNDCFAGLNIGGEIDDADEGASSVDGVRHGQRLIVLDGHCSVCCSRETERTACPSNSFEAARMEDGVAAGVVPFAISST